MPGTPFAATVRNSDGATVVDLHGDIDRGAAAGLEAAYQKTTGDGPIVLNFDEVGYINSTGIALIVSFLAKARADKREVSAYGLSDHYREIFSITRLVDFVTLFEDEQTAVAAAS